MRTANFFGVTVLLMCGGLVAACGGGGNNGSGIYVEHRKGVQVTNESGFVIERRDFRLYDVALGGWTPWVVEQNPRVGWPDRDTVDVWTSDMAAPSWLPYFPTGDTYTEMELVLYAVGVHDGILQDLRYQRAGILFGENLLAMSVREYEFLPVQPVR